MNSKEIKIGNYVYVIELRNNFEFSFYLDRNKSHDVFEDQLDLFSFGEYEVDHDFKVSQNSCPNPIKLKTELIDFIVNTVKRKKLSSFAFSWNEKSKQNVYLLAANFIKNKINNYEYYLDNKRKLIIYIKNDY